MRSLVLAVLLVPSLGALGCSATVGDEIDLGDDGDTRGASTQRADAVHGNLAVQQVVTLRSAGDPAAVRSHVSARFIRATGNIGPAMAQQLVAPSAQSVAHAPLGCAWDEPAAPTPLDAPHEGSVELLDVGEIVLRTLGQDGGGPGQDGGVDGELTLPLAARAFPDVGALVSGVVYTSRDDTVSLPTDGPYLIETTGSARVEGFSLEVHAPPPPANVTVDGRPFGDVLHLVPGALTFGWDAAEAPGSHGSRASWSEDDRIYVDLQPVDGETAVRCVFEDDGAAYVPAAFLEAWPAEIEVDVAVHRVRRRALAVSSGHVQGAVVDFDFGVATRATLH